MKTSLFLLFHPHRQQATTDMTTTGVQPRVRRQRGRLTHHHNHGDDGSGCMGRAGPTHHNRGDDSCEGRTDHNRGDDGSEGRTDLQPRG